MDKKRSDFVGAAASLAASRNPTKVLVGLEVDIEGLEYLHERVALPMEMPSGAHRDPVVLSSGGQQVGRVTSRAWSPLLKKVLALGTVLPECGRRGSKLEVDAWVNDEQVRVSAEVVSRPFFDPTRKKA